MHYVEIWHNDKKVKTVEDRMEAMSVLRGFVKMANMSGMDIDIEGWYFVVVTNENIIPVNPEQLLK